MSPSSRAEQPPVIGGPRVADPATALSRALELVGLYLPQLASAAAAENPAVFSLADRPASWALAALVWRAASSSTSMDASAWWADSTEADWAALGFAGKPGRRQALQYLPAALKSEPAKTRSARALVFVLGDVVAHERLPGSHVDRAGKRRIVAAAR